MTHRNAERGTVLAVSDGRATIELQPHNGCEACGLCHARPDGRMVLELDAPPGLTEGKTVLVANATPSSWSGAVLLFLLPLLGLLTGLGVGAALLDAGTGGQIGAAGLGLGGLILFLSGGFIADRRLHRKAPPVPYIVEIY